VEEVDNLGQENQKMSHYMHQLHKQKQNQAKWLANRKLENAARAEKGQSLLSEEGDPTNPIFKPIPNHSKLESLLIRSQIGVYCDQINAFAGTSFSKLFLLGGVQK
jgi:translation initiation factor 3 subunit H